MWILSTLGSLAVQKYVVKPTAKKLAKAITPKATKSSGGSSVSKPKVNIWKIVTPTLESLDNSTQQTIWGETVEWRTWVTTWIWFWEWQTVDSISKGYSVPSYTTPRKTNPLYTKAVEEVKAIENSSFAVKRAKELDSSWTDWFTWATRIFSNTKNIDGKSISELKLARDKAIKDVNDFSNPNSALHQSFKKNIEAQWYDYEKDFSQYIKDVNTYVEWIKADKSSAYESSGIRWYMDLPIIRSVVNKATGWEYGKFTDAIEQAKSEWVEWIESGWAYMTANLLWGWLLYGIMGGLVSRAWTVGLSEAGFGVWGNTWGRMVAAANRLKAIEQSSPTLYAIAVDNPLTTAIDYGVTKSLGGKYTWEDVSQALITGTALPLIFKGATSWLGWIWKWITTRQLNEIDSSVNALTKDWAMTQSEAMMKVANEYEIEPWKTIIQAMDESGVIERNSISWDEVRSGLAKQWISVSSLSSKKISSVINNLNKRIEKTIWDENPLWGYWELWESGKAQLAKQSIIAKTNDAKILDAKTTDDIIKTSLEENGIKFDKTEVAVQPRDWDVLDDAMHNPRFSWTKLKNAETMDEVGEALTWEWRGMPRLEEIAWARANISVGSDSAEKSVRAVAKAAWIEIDERKIVTKITWEDGTISYSLNSKYAEDILYRAEVRATGYTAARSSALARTKRLISEWVTSVRKWVANFSRTLKLWAEEYKKMKKESGDSLFNSSSYSYLHEKTRRTIIDSTLRSVNWSIDSLEKRLAVADERLHIATYNRLERDVDSLVKEIKKKSKSRTKKNTIDLWKEEEIILAYKEFNEAKIKWDLVGMKNVLDNMKLFAKEGRNIYKEDIEIRKEVSRNSAMGAITELELQWKESFAARLVNTPSSGTAGQTKWVVGNTLSFIEDMLPTHEQFIRYFGRDSIVTDKMYKAFSKAESKTQLASHKIMGNWHSTFNAIKKWLKWDDDSLIQQYTLWRNSKSTFKVKDAVISWHDYNIKNDMIGYYDKNGNPQLITVRDWDKFRAKNIERIKSWEFIDFWSKTWNEEAKEDFLNRVYKKFDNMYASSKAFKDGEDFFRTHFDANGKKNEAIMRRVYNRKMETVDMYNPIYIYWKTHNDINLWEVGELMWESFIDTIDASHTLSRVWPWQDVRMVLDFATLLERHVNGSIHWWNTIEPLNEAEAMFRMMKKGKTFIKTVDDAADVVAKEMWFGSTEWASPYNTMMGKWDVFVSNASSAWERLMTPEVERFLAENIKKYATRSGSISWAWVQIGQNKTLWQFIWRAYKTMLTWWTTWAKQLLSEIDINTLTWAKNWSTSVRSIWLHGNYSFLLDESGHLLDRQAERFSGSYGKKVTIKWARSLDQKIFDALDVPADLILANVVKWVDGWMSTQSLLAWISKVLDEKYPNLHTAWSDLNLKDIKEKLSKVDYIDWVRVVDDSEWRDVLSEWEIVMHQIMGSNSMVDDALGARWPLGKMVQFMGKAATNRVVAHWDAIVHNSMNRQIIGRTYGSDKLDKARTVSYWVTWSAIATVYSEWLKELNSQYDEWSGKKTAADTEKAKNPITEFRDKKDVDSFIAFWSAWFQSQFFQPQTTFDIMAWYKWVSDSIKDYGKQESTEGKIKAWAAIAASVVPVHWRITDMAKKGIYDATWFDMRRSWLTDEAKSWASVKSIYGDEFKSLSQSQKDELIAQQNKLSKYNKDNKKPDIKSDFIEEIASGNRKLSEQEFVTEVAKRSELKASIKTDAELKSLYERHITSLARTSWEKDSLLMWKSIQTVYDVEIVPLMEAWRAWDAFERVKELRQKWVIKSDKWALQIIESMKEYQKLNP